MNEIPSDLRELYKTALMTRERAYSPYSHHKVGAAIKLDDGRIFGGCNVENSSYGATVCAERVAIQKAVSESGKIKIAQVLVITDSDPAWPPCGMCRQVIAEFGPQAQIITANLKGDLKTLQLAELFPQAFTPEHLQKELRS